MRNGVPDSDQNLGGVDSAVESETSVDFEAMAKSIISKLDAAGLKNKVEEIYMGASSEILQTHPKIFFTFMQSIFEVAGEVSYLRDELARFGKEAGVSGKKSIKGDDATRFMVRGVDKLSRLGLEEGNSQGRKSVGMSQQLQEKQFVDAKEKLAALQSVLGQEGDLELAQKYYLSRIVGFFNQVQVFLNEVELFKTAAEKRFAEIDRGTPEGQGILVSLTSLRGRVEELIVSEKSLLAWLETFLNVNKGYVDPGIQRVLGGFIGKGGLGRRSSYFSLVPKEPSSAGVAVGLTPTPGGVAVDSGSGHGRLAQKKAPEGGKKDVGSVTAMIRTNAKRVVALKAVMGAVLGLAALGGIAVGAKKMFSGEPVSASAAGKNVDAGIGMGESAKAVESAKVVVEPVNPSTATANPDVKMIVEPIVEPVASAEIIQEIPAKDAGAALVDAGTVLATGGFAAGRKNSPAGSSIPGSVSASVAPSSVPASASALPAAGLSAAPTAKESEEVPVKPRGDVVNPWGESEEK